MQMPWEVVLPYLAHHPRWFENVTRRQPGSAHLREYRAAMPGDWRLRRHGYWLIADPPGMPEIGQGWKLHVSATSRTSAETLRRCLPVLREAGVRFKFLMDPAAVNEANGKTYARASSGKFIAVYPEDLPRFHAVAKALTEATDGLDGPYVLSDRRYPGSRVVHYRYGGFTSRFELLPTGLRDLLIEAPDGSLVADERTPYWSAPHWAGDPFAHAVRSPAVPPATSTVADPAADPATEPEQAAPAGEPDPAPLLDGRFRADKALLFSNRGGIYRGTDIRTGAEVVLREARPGVEVGPQRIDAVPLLRHEYNLLTELAGTGFFVRPVAYFTQWEHAFLVEEFVDGDHIGRLSTSQNPLYGLDMTPERLAAYYQRLQGLWLQIADAIAACHERGIVLGDLSATNIMVTEDDRIRIIDLESAFHEGVDRGAGLSTPGLVTLRARAAGCGDRRTDYYALGGLLLSCVLACQQSDVVDHAIPLRLLAEVAADLALPAELVELITDLYDEEAALPDPAELRARIAALPFGRAWRQPPPLARPAPSDPERGADLRRRVRDVLDGVADFLVGAADPTREDRLFPADLLVFETNPLSLAYGAYGCLYALHLVRGRVPDELLGWALRRDTGHETLPPGLYYGSAGAAWALSALGHREQAVALLRDAAGHPLLEAEPGVTGGMAGHGMACLRLWRDSGLPEFLDRARAIGARLAETAERDGVHAHWRAADGRIPVGYGDGASGVAMFLLALHAATGAPEPLELGRAALEFDLSCAEYSPHGLLCFPASAGKEGPASVLRHYWDEGTAGVLTTLLRYAAVTGDEQLRKQVDRLLPDVRRKYTAFPQLFHGISGIANALLDAYEFLGDPELLGDAERAAEAVLCSAVRRPEGVVFPGEQTLRESADLATGSAGIALFLLRLERTAPGARTNANFLLDDLLRDLPDRLLGGRAGRSSDRGSSGGTGGGPADADAGATTGAAAGAVLAAGPADRPGGGT
ncbi:Protein kinase domain-containing protein [Actinacidiphila yanglinensis]|uniref:Protein kinase domain-containing protein n=1 Tax=Actinacidiphila yanglinensis TaxID=310779 RepID=A0A1H6B1N5_9ACTN|nr:class III lanthionine synthetase LanKC [Actinacidiphila yanglinensis]SEG54137.1 Protein kinase domain-containing protein [Actinacidiphila yanglinensis]